MKEYRRMPFYAFNTLFFQVESCSTIDAAGRGFKNSNESDRGATPTTVQPT